MRWRTRSRRCRTWAAQQGIAQFADLGTGTPTNPSVGTAARAVSPDARIAYVDDNPVVALHVRALLAASDGIASVNADLTDPAAVLARPDVRAVIDPAEPACIVLGLVLSLMPARLAPLLKQSPPGHGAVTSLRQCAPKAPCARLLFERGDPPAPKGGTAVSQQPARRPLAADACPRADDPLSADQRAKGQEGPRYETA